VLVWWSVEGFFVFRHPGEGRGPACRVYGIVASAMRCICFVIGAKTCATGSRIKSGMTSGMLSAMEWGKLSAVTRESEKCSSKIKNLVRDCHCEERERRGNPVKFVAYKLRDGSLRA